MTLNSILHLVPLYLIGPSPGKQSHISSNPISLHTFDFRVQLYVWNDALMTKDLQHTLKLHGLVSVVLIFSFMDSLSKIVQVSLAYHTILRHVFTLR